MPYLASPRLGRLVRLSYIPADIINTLRFPIAHDNDCGVMLAHYLTSCLTLVNRCIFSSLLCLFEHWAQIKIPRAERSSGSNFHAGVVMHFSYATGMWFCTKYHYHFPITILVLTCVTLMDPISYFCRLLSPGIYEIENVLCLIPICLSL